MLEGKASRDFAGEPMDAAYARIAAQARVVGFSVEGIAKLGVQKSALRDLGGELEDGSVILTDLESLRGGESKSFDVEVNGHRFSGSYRGVFALKSDAEGTLEKVACGACSELRRDGRLVVKLKHPADLVLKREADGSYAAVLGGAEGSNAVTMP